MAALEVDGESEEVEGIWKAVWKALNQVQLVWGSWDCSWDIRSIVVSWLNGSVLVPDPGPMASTL